MKINSVVVLCWAGDFRLARICLASVRYFYPEIALYLMKDVSKGDFDTAEVEKYLNVSTAGLSGVYGPGAGKLELLFRPDLGRFLFIDADQIMVGPVLDALEGLDAQFVVTPDYFPGVSIDRFYYDRQRLKAIDPAYRVPPFHFNSGQFVGTPGVISRRDFGGLVNWGGPITVRDSTTFKLLEQGVLNYVVHKMATAGRITLAPADFMHLARTEYFWSVRLDSIKARNSQPLLFHWAGTHRSFLSLMRRSDLLRFFESQYYNRIKHGSSLRLWRSLKAAPQSAYRCLHHLAGVGKRSALAWSGKRPLKAKK